MRTSGVFVFAGGDPLSASLHSRAYGWHSGLYGPVQQDDLFAYAHFPGQFGHGVLSYT